MTLDSWPFWAPSRHEAVIEALELAGVGPGVHVLDLGCGDGSVLLTAATLGASVSGVETDEDLADEAAQRLADAGVDADIVCGDLFDPVVRFDADVFFTYLAPATLQRLMPRFAEHRGTPLVTVDFDVPGLIPTRRGEAARLYRLPGRRRRVGPVGWASAGTLVSTVPDVQSLTCLELVHPAGPVEVRVDGTVADLATVAVGADHLDGAGFLAVDLRWEEPVEGTVAGGTIHTAGAGSHDVFVIATDHEDEAQWDLTDEGVTNIRRALGSSRPPRTAAEMVTAADG